MVQSSALLPPNAHLVVLAFLGTAAAASLAVVAAAVFALAGRRRFAFWCAGGAAVIVAGYTLLLFALSLTAREVRLAPGARKYFCEIDCHLAYSVESVSREPLRSGHERLLVGVRTWFDENTIAPWRGDAPLTPNPREVRLVDRHGRLYPPVLEDPAGGLSRTLRPGESYITRFGFEPAAAVSGPLRLLVADPPGIEILLLSHENSPFHSRIYFDLPSALKPRA